MGDRKLRIEMIVTTVREDWDEYFGELGMNAYATCKRIVEELGSFLCDADTKRESLLLLQTLVIEHSPQDGEALSFLQSELQQ